MWNKMDVEENRHVKKLVVIEVYGFGKAREDGYVGGIGLVRMGRMFRL